MSAKYSSGDKDMFIQILSKYPIIEDKKSDTRHIEQKRIAWDKITVEFNAAATEEVSSLSVILS